MGFETISLQINDHTACGLGGPSMAHRKKSKHSRAKVIAEGKVLRFGLSEASPNTIRKAMRFSPSPLFIRSIRL